MKKWVFILALALFAGAGSAEASAQSFLENLGKQAIKRAKDRAEQKVEDKVNQKVDEAVDRPFNKAEKALKGSGGKAEEATAETNPARQTSAPNTAEPQEEGQTPPAAAGPTLELTYAKSDFVRGDEVFFEDNLSGEQVGEFPSQWDLLKGSVEVATLNGVKAIVAQQVHDWITPLFEDMTNYLPEKFTLEFDFWCEPTEAYNTFHILFTDAKDHRTQDTQSITLSGVGEETANMNWDYQVQIGEGREGRGGHMLDIQLMQNAWNHFAYSFNKRAAKIYLNGVRVANIPNTVQAKIFSIRFAGDGIGRMTHPAIRNIVLAKGAVPLYDRMLTEGKFITYGITFDVGKSLIKPESMGEINRIVQLMTENPDLKFSVEGHTDATGNATANQKLSEDRAAAIVAKLVELGIDASRLQSVGKGQNSPIADNSTDEGRAKNRRVEFVKL